MRLASYEDQEEADYLTGLYRGRDGLLNNTTFALVAPDGKTLLDRSGRGPSFLIDAPRDPDTPATAENTKAFALRLEAAMQPFEPKAAIGGLPQSLDFRRALNVAACDNQPLVVAFASTSAGRKEAEARLAGLAWKEAFIGRLQYAIVGDRNQLEGLGPLPEGDFLAVVQPGLFGQDGTILRSLPLSAEDPQVQDLLRRGIASFQRKGLDQRRHVERGRREGVDWETEITVTDSRAAGPEPTPRRRDR